MNKIIVLLSLFLNAFALPLLAQKHGRIVALPIEKKFTALDTTLSNYQVFKVDTKSAKELLVSNHLRAELDLQFSNEHSWTIYIESANILGGNLTADIWNGEKVVKWSRAFDPTFKGVTNQGADVRLTIDEHYFSGSIRTKNQTWMIQPITDFDRTTEADYIVVYDAKNIKEQAKGKCGVEDVQKKTQQIHHEVGIGNKSPLDCYELEYASCTDYSFFQKYGSTVSGVQNRVLTIINLTEGDYSIAFNHTLKLFVRRWFNSISPTEPWSNSVDAYAFLIEFQNWAEANLTGAPNFDIGQLWTNRVFGNSILGIAYTGEVCSPTKYQCIMDFTSDSDLMRVVVSHETGHNLSCDHDVTGSPTIMAPNVQSVTNWSTLSIYSVNTFVPPLITSGCLAPCAAGNTPTASYTTSPTNLCENSPVTFTNTSTNSPISYYWSFQNGIPATSTDANPIVTWASSGTYGVTLTVTNAVGTNIKKSSVLINGSPTSTFTPTINGLQVLFNNTSINTTNYNWAFGDGGTSTVKNPVYSYFSFGTYNVTLTTSGLCGTKTLTQSITLNPILNADFSSNTNSGCKPLTVSFTNASTLATSYNWLLQGATPANSTAINPTVVYNDEGSFNVELTASNGTTSKTVLKNGYITVSAAPIPKFTYSVVGNTVNFNNTTTGANSYLWKLGNNTTSTLASPSVTYLNSGNYTVTLTATNPCGQNTIIQTISVSALPLPSFTYTNSEGCTPLIVQYTNTSVGANAYEWTFPGGVPATSTAVNPSVTYSVPGVYSVVLKATNSAGSEYVAAPNKVIISNSAVSNFNTTLNKSTATFTNSSTYATSYLWNFGDGTTSTDINPTHVFQNDGTYMVTLTAQNTCSSNTRVKKIVISTPPKASFSVPTTNNCIPLNLTLNNTSTSNVLNYKWTFVGATPTTSTEKNPTVVYDKLGEYSIKLVVSNANGKDSVLLTNIVKTATKPESNFSKIVDKSKVTFTNLSKNALTYLWEFGNGDSSVVENPTFIYPTDGTYKVSLTATNACSSTLYTNDIQIATAPKASFSSTLTSGCIPFKTTFANTSSSNSQIYLWQFVGGTPTTSSDKNPIVTYNSVGEFDVNLIVSNTVGKDTFVLKKYIKTVNPPVPLFSKKITGSTVQFTNTSQNAKTYFWDFGDGSNSTDVSPVHAYTKNAKYLVTLEAINELCSSFSKKDTINLEISNALNTLDLDEIRLYPNPVTSELNIDYPTEKLQNAQLIITDIQGRVLYQKSISKIVEMSNFAKGIYFVIIKTDTFKQGELIIRRKILVL